MTNPNIAKRFYPEIQGLRAISIIAVILFHLGVGVLPGGYAGVDVFFVISGFVITRMIAGELERGTFSVARFYKHRVVRLLPNLFLMIAASVVISYLVLKPYDFLQYAKSLQFSAIYLTNMVFARQQGYFDLSGDVKPLLHTWSLSIEEQFYLVFPVLLILLYRLRSHRIAVLALIALASLWVRFDYIQQQLPSEGFFSFAGRVWEFVAGALVALMPAALKDRLSGNEALSLAGLALILASLLFLDESVPYSGILLLVPCLATALVIACGSGTRAGRWLGGKTLVFIGGLSYSLYLWHWPLIVWFHNADHGLGRIAEISLLLLLTAAISYVAWRFVEEPFRDNREKFSGRMVAGMTLAFAAFCIGIGSYIYAQRGMEERFPAWVEVEKNVAAFDFAAATGTQPGYPAGCGIGDEPNAADPRFCTFGDAASKERFLLLGDSHARAAFPAFKAAAEDAHAAGVMAIFAGCPPLFGVSSFDGAKDICAKSFDERVGKLIADGGFSKVFLVAHWSLYSEGKPDGRPSHLVSDAETASRDAASSKQVMARHLRETIARINKQGIAVVIMHSVPILPKMVQDLPAGYTQPLARIREQNRFMDDFVREWQGGGLSVIDPTPIFCGEGVCRTRDDGLVLYTDNNHVSPAGAARLVELIRSGL